MTKTNLLRFTALLISLALALGGCSGGGGSGAIVLEELPTEAPSLDPDADGRAEFYSEDSAVYYNGEVMPAPVDTTPTAAPAEDIPAEDIPAEDIPTEGFEEAPPLQTVNIKNGDVTLGVVVGTDAEVNPLRCSYRDLINVNALVYESLVELDEAMRPQPQLADRWTTDGTMWTFTLRSGIVFHDGAPLTAEDVVASYKEILNYPAGRWYPLVSQLEGMTAVDSQNVQVKAAGSMGYMMLYIMTFPVVSASSVYDTTPMGTGPFWYIQYSVNNGLRIESNPLWWRRASEDIHSLVAVFYPSTRAALAALETGDIDTIATESATASLARNLNDRMTVDYSTQTYECLIPNLDRQLLSSLAVRRAIMYAVDRTTVAQTVYAGLTQESEVPVQPGAWLYETQSTMYNYSPERALQALYEDGWSDPDSDGVLQKEMGGSIVKLEFVITTYDRGVTSTRTDAARAIADQLNAVGFSVTVDTIAKSEVLSNLRNGKFDLALAAFELSDLPNLAFLLSSAGECNYSRYESAEMDVLLKQAYDAQDAETLKSAMSKIQLLIVQDLPVLGLFFRSGLVVSKQSIGGLSGARQGNVLRGLATATR